MLAHGMPYADAASLKAEPYDSDHAESMQLGMHAKVRLSLWRGSLDTQDDSLWRVGNDVAVCVMDIADGIWSVWGER